MPLERKYEDIFSRLRGRLDKLNKEMTRTREELNQIRLNSEISDEAKRLADKAISTVSAIELEAHLGGTSMGGSLELYRTEYYKKRH